MAQELPRVLIIDDDKAVQSGLTRLLRRNGFDVATASMGRRALKRLRLKKGFDCLIVELLLPDMMGSEFIQTLVSEKICQPKQFLVLTNVQNADNATLYMQFGVGGYFGKPFDNQRILDQVRAICGVEKLPTDLDAII